MENERITIKSETLTWECNMCNQPFLETASKQTIAGKKFCENCRVFNYGLMPIGHLRTFISCNSGKYLYIQEYGQKMETEEEREWFILARDKFFKKYNDWITSEAQKIIKEIEDW